MWLEQADAAPLKRELVTAFGRTELQAHDNQGDARCSARTGNSWPICTGSTRL